MQPTHRIPVEALPGPPAVVQAVEIGLRRSLVDLRGQNISAQSKDVDVFLAPSMSALWRGFLYFFCTDPLQAPQVLDYMALPTGFEPVLQP